MKNKISAVIIFVIVLIVIIAVTYTSAVNKAQVIGEKVYDDFSVKIDDINKLIDDDIVGYVYFGRDTCPVCLHLNKFLKPLCNENDLTLYKFDTDYWRENENFNRVLEKYNIDSIPAIIELAEDRSYRSIAFTDDKKIELQLKNFFKDNKY